nr:pre-mRNA-splicing factor CWC22-like [Ipomoea batatas]GME17358.1 pre-mRNA-splicing factor CWC22-like [Ipomoea batatas]
MGNCCASTAVKGPSYSHSAPNSKHRITSLPLITHPLLEEETVKEVLSSETPTVNVPKPAKPPLDNNGPRKHPTLAPEPENDGDLKKPTAAVTDFNPDDLSEDFSSSEICSTLSESVPADKSQRSPARVRNRAFPGEKSVGNSPSRRFEPSSLGRVRSGTGRDNSARRSPAHRPRKESYENAGRRSVSPVMRRENGGARTGLVRSPSVRKTGKSPGRVRSDVGDKNRKMEENRGNKEKWETTNSNDLLENPLKLSVIIVHVVYLSWDSGRYWLKEESIGDGAAKEFAPVDKARELDGQ